MEELTQTVAVLYCLASAQTASICSSVALGARSVWSIKADTSASVVGTLGSGAIGASALRSDGRDARSDLMPAASDSCVTLDMVLCDQMMDGR